MGLRFPDQRGHSVFFVTTTFADWHRYGDIPEVYPEITDSINHYCATYSAKVPAYVLMPSHLHLILSIAGDTLGPYMRDFKKYTAQTWIRNRVIRQSSIWMARYDRVALVTSKVTMVKVEYIHYNPVKAGLVGRPEEWLWSSASDYLRDVAGPVKVCKDW